MKKKTIKSKEARVDTPLDKLNEKETLMHYNAVLMEDLRSNMKLVLEKVLSLDAKVESLDAKFDQKIDNLEMKMGERMSTLEQGFRGLKDDMIDMERRICSKINRITDRCQNHDLRLTTLETSH